MCGIVGYTGLSNCIEPILEGLSRLEYRGYDSAGICLLIDSNLIIEKKEGKLFHLKEKLAQTTHYSTTGIGHTRWATHGIVSADNAHPHGNEFFGVVHNGIIENATELKKELKSEGFEFKSQTDSEVFLVLLTKFFHQTQDTLKAISKAFQMVSGNSAFVIMEKSSQKIYAVKRSAPLVCGVNELKSEVFLSSDPFALIGYAPQIYFPQDEVIVVGEVKNKLPTISFYDLNLNPSKGFKEQSNLMSLDVTSKGNHEHFMLKEIYEQPKLMDMLFGTYLKSDNIQKLEKLKGLQAKRIIIIGCGTAWHAGLVIRDIIEKNNQIPCIVEIASEFRYRNPIVSKEDVALFISQSGETADTLACQELCKKKGLKTLAIVNTEGSTLFRNVDDNFLIYAGLEIGVASTKAFTQQVLVGYLMSQAIKNNLKSEKIFKEFSALSIAITGIFDNVESIIGIAEKIYTKKGFLYTGRGAYYPIALEGALKLKEIAYVHAEGYPAGELKHGPIALIDENMVNIALVGAELFEKTFSNVEEVKARRGIIVAIGPQDSEDLKNISDEFYGLDFKGLETLGPLMVNVVLQFLSYYVAKLKGTDIDKPRNLAKSVTVE